MPRRRDRMVALGGLLPAAGVLYGVVARPRINQWGATDQEHRATWPGDRLLAQPGYFWTNAITIQRPADQVWPWLVQLGQGRGGLYSYDWLENLVGCDIHSADRILPQFQQPLRVGDRVIRMAQYAPSNPVALFEPGRALVLGGVNDADADLAAGRPSSTWAFIVHPVDQHRTRLLIRSRGSSLMGRIQGPIQFVMQRKAMVGIKQRAEGTWSPSPVDVIEPLLWLLAAGVLVAASARVLVQREQWWRPYMVAVGAMGAVPGLLFWQPPIALGAVVDGVLLRALIGSRRPRRLAAGGRRRR
jgi:hypothetical protein